MSLFEFLGGYRFFGHWKQSRIYNKEQLKDMLSRWAGLDDCGITISTFKDGIPILLFIPFDFDSKDLKLAFEEAVRTFNFFVSLGYRTWLNYTGNRGFHVLIKSKPEYYSKYQLKTFQNQIKLLLNLTTCDSQIFGDYRRLIRIPGTYHRNGGLARILAVDGLRELDLNQFVKDTIPTNGIIKKSQVTGKYHEYPCVEAIIREDPEPPQLIRFAYVVLRLADGCTPEQIFDEIKSFGWIDFDEQKTIYQINHIASRDYKPPSCKTLRDLGYCIIPNCKFKNKPRQEWVDKYPHLERYL